MKTTFTSVFFLSAISQTVFSQSELTWGTNSVSPGTVSNQVSVQNGNSALGFTYSDSACGLNYVQASVMTTTRYTPIPGTGLPTTLSISGLPASYSVQKAYLWYLASYQSSAVPSATTTITNPNSQTFTDTTSLIGNGISVCWGEMGTASYRADVSSAISGNGNYIINISGFTNPNWEVDGVTLFIIYRDLAANYRGTIVIHDGIMAGVGNNFTQTMSGLNVCANSINASGFVIVGDMQSNVNGGMHPSTINGVTANYPNNFWNFDTAATSVTSGQTSSTFGTDGLGNDCFGWMAMGLYYQTNCPCIGGVNDLSALPAITVSPNPFGDYTTIKLSGGQAANYEIKIYDIIGQEVVGQGAIIRNRDSFVIHRDNLISGFYLYKLIAKDGRYAAGKLVVK